MPDPRLPQHFYATFGVMYRDDDEQHPTLPRHIAHPDKVIEIWAPTKTIARSLITGLTLTVGDSLGRHDVHHADDIKAHYGDLYDWPTTLEQDKKFAEYYPGGVSMVIDCREL